MEERESSCFDVFVAEQLLDGANVVAVFEQVGGEGVAEGVRADALGDASGVGSGTDGFLRAACSGVVTANDTGARVDRHTVGSGQ